MPFLAASILLAAAPGPLPAIAGGEPPPGLVLVEGGRTKVGTSQKDVERLIQENPTLAASFGPLTGETPQSTVEVGDFYLMVTEVTNEQYEQYVKVAGARPPFLWGGDAVEVARQEFLKAQAEQRESAKAKGEPPPARQEFNPQEWWLQNWQGKPWKVPDGLACRPVVFVDYQDAAGYARWAGMRLMTEEEYQRAVRGDTDRSYPWGDNWESGKYAGTQEIQKVSDALEVGHFPEGATANGIFDLAGNVWEWTSSKFVKYPNYKPFTMELGKGNARKTLDTMPGFNPDHRVVVGGSIQNTRFLARCTIRRGTSRDTQTNSVGFRCAASPERGRDVADTLIRDIPAEVRPKNVNGALEYDSKLAIALDHWQTAEPTCKVANYAVVQSYDYILFCPVGEVYQVTMKDLRDYSLADHPVPLGFLATNQVLREPALEPGCYLVAFRGAGESPKSAKQPEKSGEKPAGQASVQESGQEPTGEKPAPVVVPLEQQIQFDVTVDNYIFYDLAGKPVLAFPAKDADLARPIAGSMAFVDRTVKVPGPAKEGQKPKMVDEVQSWLELGLAVPARARKVFQGKIALRFADGVEKIDWRQ